MFFFRQWLFYRHDLRMPAVNLGIRRLLGFGCINMLNLETSGSNMLFMHGNLLLGRRPVLNAVGAAAEGDMVGVGYARSLDDRAVNESGVDDGFIHMDHRGVVGKFIAAPLAAGKADAEIAATVVHAAVVAYVPAPVALIKAVLAAAPAPVAGRP
jgi:hypothetical protein